MKAEQHLIAEYMNPFFHDYLVGQRGLSANTQLSYRDSLKLFFLFISENSGKSVDRIKIEDLTDSMVFAFLGHLETKRQCSARTRNSRLAAIRTFFTFLGRNNPVFLMQCHRIKSIQQKKTRHKIVDYLEENETQAFFESIDTVSRTGLRDKALFLSLYNTGARVQEIVDIKICDIRFDTPGQVKISGKGNKSRLCPLWPETITAIREYLGERLRHNLETQHVFLNANGAPITRFGIRCIVRKYADLAKAKCPAIGRKSIGPHTFRHTTAMHLLRAGNDINMVRLWLGHADIQTTHCYIEIDMEMKRKILETCQSPRMGAEKANKWLKPDVLKWLDNLAKSPELCGVK